MLSRLHIQNYAIIDDLQIEFACGLNIVTGETGAGKSILMGALNLILGQRADSAVLQQKEKKAIVEGWFSVEKNELVKSFLEANDLDQEDEIAIRREIAANGKSRSFINDTPVNLTQLKSLSVLLVDLHQQFDTLELNTESFQREVLDAFAGNAQLLGQLKEQFDKYSNVKKSLELLVDQQQNANKELDYNKFLYTELDELSLKDNELEDLDAELKLLSNAENIKQQLSGIYLELKDSEQPIVQQIKALQNKLKSIISFHPDLGGLSERLSSVVIESQDIADELERIDDCIHFDQQRIEIINEKISAGYKLLKKHNVKSTSELIAIKMDLESKLEAVLGNESAIENLEKESKLLLDDCTRSAKKISENRAAARKPFCDKVNNLLAQVGMPNAQIKVDLREAGLTSSGLDSIEFLFDANKSKRFEPLSKVASGGELSRLMLSIKSLVAQKLELPTLIFDEIDTGISGEAARQVGIIMNDLSGDHQLIAITHQPQIAAKAAAHYFVYKEVKGDRISTSIRLLDENERITAIAKMLSGEKPTAAAFENAREMVLGL